jgi:hypothetical protein
VKGCDALVRVYLDNCCFNRPFDEQGQTRGLGRVDAERFITSVISEPLDYTVWQRTLFEGLSVRELSDAAMRSYESA